MFIDEIKTATSKWERIGKTLERDLVTGTGKKDF